MCAHRVNESKRSWMHEPPEVNKWCNRTCDTKPRVEHKSGDDNVAKLSWLHINLDKALLFMLTLGMTFHGNLLRYRRLWHDENETARKQDEDDDVDSGNSLEFLLLFVPPHHIPHRTLASISHYTEEEWRKKRREENIHSAQQEEEEIKVEGKRKLFHTFFLLLLVGRCVLNIELSDVFIMRWRNVREQGEEKLCGRNLLKFH